MYVNVTGMKRDMDDPGYRLLCLCHVHPSFHRTRKDYEEVGIETAEAQSHHTDSVAFFVPFESFFEAMVIRRYSQFVCCFSLVSNFSFVHHHAI
jgi:hypothetical protein